MVEEDVKDSGHNTYTPACSFATFMRVTSPVGIVSISAICYIYFLHSKQEYTLTKVYVSYSNVYKVLYYQNSCWHGITGSVESKHKALLPL